jgi:hypothetical protein
MSTDFINLTTRLAASMSIFAGLLIGGLGVFALLRGTQRFAPAIGIGRRIRTLQLGAGIGLAIAIVIGAMPAVAFPADVDRFTRLYGVLGGPIQFLMTALVAVIIATGIGAVFLRRENRPDLRR